MKIFITGFSGAGKTTLGKRLSKHPTFQVFDLDEEVFNRMGSGHEHLGEYIEDVGLEAFRADELDMLRLLDQNFKDNYLIILGGGTLEIPCAIEHIKNIGGQLIFLDTPFDLCWHRIAELEDRPLAKKGKEHMYKLYERRLPVFNNARLSLEPEDVAEINTIEDLIARIN